MTFGDIAIMNQSHITTLAAVETVAGADFFPDLTVPAIEERRLWDVSGADFRSLVAAPCRRIQGRAS